MKILKRILLVVVIIIAIPLLLALFVKRNYFIEREVAINQPKEIVFEYIKLLKNQNNYSKWAKMDLNARYEYRGEDGKKGFVSAWQSDDKNVGKGEQQITNIEDGRMIEYNLHFIEPFETTSYAYMTTEALDENSTKVKWGFKTRMPYPMNLMGLFMDMDKMVGQDLEVGLANLKQILENQ